MPAESGDMEVAQAARSQDDVADALADCERCIQLLLGLVEVATPEQAKAQHKDLKGNGWMV